MNPLELTARREALGLSQADLADYFDVKQLTVSRWEKGHRYPSDDTFLVDGLDTLEAFLDSLTENLWEDVEAQLPNAGTITIATYANNADWHAQLEPNDPHLPVKVHQAAAGRVRYEAAQEYDRAITIAPAHETD